MGERILLRIAELLDRGVPIKRIRDVRGTAYLAPREEKVHYDAIDLADYDLLKTDKTYVFVIYTAVAGIFVLTISIIEMATGKMITL